MKRRALLGHLQEHGCVPVREGGSHSRWSNPLIGRKEAIPRHNEIKNTWRVPSAATFPCRSWRATDHPHSLVRTPPPAARMRDIFGDWVLQIFPPLAGPGGALVGHREAKAGFP